MPTKTTLAHACENLAALCNEVALVSAAELRSLMETAHLLRSPRNAQRLLTALIRVQDRAIPAEKVEGLRL